MNIYVGNLSYDVSSTDLLQSFQVFGHVASANVVRDRDSGESRGFGFVEMPDKNEANEAISSLDGQELKGRNMKISEAKPKKSGQSRFSGNRENRGGFGR